MASRADKTAAEAQKRASAVKKTTTSGSSTGKKGASGAKKAPTPGKSGGSTSAGNAAFSSRQSGGTEEASRDFSGGFLVQETVMWIVLAVCIFLFISYFGIGGYLGDVIRDLSFGAFGIAAYGFPPLLFLAVGFLISNRGSIPAGIKFVAAVALYFTVCSFFGLSDYPYPETMTLGELFAHSAAAGTGGGIVGGMVCRLLCPALGVVGTSVFLLIFSIICVVLITQRSVWGGMKRQSRRMYESARESSARRREAYEQERSRRMEEASLQIPEFSRVETSGLQRSQEPGDSQEQAFRPQHSQEPGTRVEGEQALKKERARKRERPSLSAEHGMQMHTEAETEDSGKTRQRHSPRRTEIEIPVIFPATPRESRHSHRVSGVTMDTLIRDDSQQRPGAELREILPSVSVQREEIPEESPTRYRRPEEPEEPLTQFCGSEDSAEEMDIFLSDEEAALRANTSAGRVFREEADKPSLERKSGKRSAGSKKARDNQSDGQVNSREAEPDGQPAGKEEFGGQPTARKNPRSSAQEIQEGIADVEAEAAKAAQLQRPEYVFPPYELLNYGKNRAGSGQEQEVRRTAAKLQQTLNSFGVHVTVTNASCGPSVTRYELLPEQGVKVSRIVSLADDIKLNLAAADIRIEAPIPGKAAVGIEVPNSENSTVALRDLLETEEFRKHKSNLAFAAGKDIGGKAVVADIAKMPHLLIAGATGSGKSVCINTLIMSILYKAKPDEVKLIMIDPKVVELSVYNGIPHLFIPVVTDPKKAAGALNWAVAEMTDRYNKFAQYGVRDLRGFNQRVRTLEKEGIPDAPERLPQIVIIVDELADLMMVAPGEVEDSICRLAQLARAAGIHLIIATQRPSVNVITGLIKANMPSRIAFAVSSGVDSRTIIDMNGAEKLLGKGDMLFYPQGYQKPARVQGAFVSDEEVSDVVDFLKEQNSSNAYNTDMEEQIAKLQQAGAARGDEEVDALFAEAGRLIIGKDKASIGMLQRVFKIGFNRAARIMDQLSDAGVVGPEEGTKPRKILMSEEEFAQYLES